MCKSYTTYYEPDTIAAIASALVPSAIGIIRLSGSLSFSIAQKIFSNHRHLLSSTSAHGFIINPETSVTIDEVMTLRYHAPHSYTAEDMLEIFCHGSPAIMRLIFELCLSCGARAAEPGEFTRRAYLNGKLDLAQAEAVNLIGRSLTTEAAVHAVAQLHGNLSHDIHQLKQSVIALRAHCEAYIEFPDDMNTDTAAPAALILPALNRIEQECRRLKKTRQTGIMMIEGAHIVIAGRTNTGKSSLFNALLNEERVIVSHEAGTTRDVITATINCNGIPITLHDTAGFKDTVNDIERTALHKTNESLQKAVLILAVFDLAQPYTPEDERMITHIQKTTTPLIVIGNKTDLPRRLELPPSVSFDCLISAANKDGIHTVYNHITEKLGISDYNPGQSMILSARIGKCIDDIYAACQKTRQDITDNQPLEYCSEGIQDIINALDAITAPTTTNDILDTIFNSFCLGK